MVMTVQLYTHSPPSWAQGCKDLGQWFAYVTGSSGPVEGHQPFRRCHQVSIRNCTAIIHRFGRPGYARATVSLPFAFPYFGSLVITLFFVTTVIHLSI